MRLKGRIIKKVYSLFFNDIIYDYEIDEEELKYALKVFHLSQELAKYDPKFREMLQEKIEKMKRISIESGIWS